MTEESTGSGRTGELAAALRGCYAEYAEYLDKYIKQREATESKLSILLMGNRQLGSLPVHEEFYRKTESLVSALAGALAQEPAPELAAGTVRWMLSGCLAGEKEPGYWMFLAVENLCTPILKHLPVEALSEIRETYRRRLRRTRALPNQKKLVRALEEELKKREHRKT